MIFPGKAPAVGSLSLGRFKPIAAILAALYFLGLPDSTRAVLVINEFLPDPSGSDSGREFVELFNSGLEPVSMEEVRLQFGNGSTGAIWETRWMGEAGATLAPGARFLIVDRNWMDVPPGDAEVYLGLQNGPDALRLTRGELVLDMVGYGSLTDGDMMEEEPAETRPGRSVARRPDGRDTGNNRNDFVSADPTPGNPNFQPYSLAVLARELDPPSLDRSGLPVRLTVILSNDGTETWPVAPVTLRVGGTSHPSLLDQLPPDQERWISWKFSPGVKGLLPLDILVPLPAVSETLVVSVGALQVGPGDLVLNEVMAAPLHGQGEWVELLAASGRSVQLDGYSLRDEDGNWRALPDLTLNPDDFLVLAQDSLALARWHLDNGVQGAVTACSADQSIACQRSLSGWPSLNNTPPEARDFADRVYLAGPSGNVVDHLTFGGVDFMMGGLAEAGVSLERQGISVLNPGASNWAPCTAQVGSTPGCGNSISAVFDPVGGFTVSPRILDPEEGVSAVHFRFNLSGAQAGWGLRVFDLWGGIVRDLGGENLGPGPRDLPWDGRNDQGIPVGSGGYVAVLEVRDRFSNCLVRDKVLMVVR